ncbi:hypothetical protein ACO0SA_004828 [Hanseniaspora valbyensis]
MLPFIPRSSFRLNGSSSSCSSGNKSIKLLLSKQFKSEVNTKDPNSVGYQHFLKLRPKKIIQAEPHKEIPQDKQKILNSQDPEKTYSLYEKQILSLYPKSAKLAALAHVNVNNFEKGQLNNIKYPTVPEKYDTFLKLDDFFDYQPGSKAHEDYQDMSRQEPNWKPMRQLLPEELYGTRVFPEIAHLRAKEMHKVFKEMDYSEKAQVNAELVLGIRAPKVLKRYLNDIQLSALAVKSNTSTEYLKKNLMNKILVNKKILKRKGSNKILVNWVLMAVGDGNGMIGIGVGKSAMSREVAISQAYKNAIQDLRMVPRYENRTIWNQIRFKQGAIDLILTPKRPGGGLHCSHVIYELCSLIGIRDMTCKLLRSRNVMNTTKTFVEALINGQHPIEDMALQRGRKIVDVKKAYFA